MLGLIQIEPCLCFSFISCLKDFGFVGPMPAHGSRAMAFVPCCPSGRTHGLHNSKRDPTGHDHQQEEHEKAANNAEGTAIVPIARSARASSAQKKVPELAAPGLQSEERAVSENEGVICKVLGR
jgi:hypothetical protein